MEHDYYTHFSPSPSIPSSYTAPTLQSVIFHWEHRCYQLLHSPRSDQNTPVCRTCAPILSFFPPIFSFHHKWLLLLGTSPSWKTEILVFWFLKDFTPLVITVLLHHQDLFLLGLSYYIQPFSKFYKSLLTFIYSFSHCTFVWLHSKSFLLMNY